MPIDKLISFHIERQFPAIYREDGPELVQFVKEYYKFLETNTSQALYNGRRIFEYRDIDSTLERMLLFFKKKYLADLPFNDETVRVVVKNILGLYRRKGTQEGLELFFTLFYNESIKVYNPSKDMFKPSDSTWTNGQYLQMYPNEGIFTGTANTEYTYADLIGKTITGSFSKAEAVVDKINFITFEKTLLPIIYINDRKGNFVNNDKLQTQITDDEAVEFGKVYGSLKTVTIDENKKLLTGNAVGDEVDIISSDGKAIGGKGVVTEISNLFTGQVNYEIVDGGWGYSVESTKLLTSTQTIVADNPDLLFNPNEDLEITDGNTAILIGQDETSFGIRTDSVTFDANVVITATDRVDSAANGLYSLKVVPDGSNNGIYSYTEALLRASTGFEPESGLFDVDIGGGRKLGDISNTGTVSSADSLAIARYIAGTQEDEDIVTFIEEDFIPYVSANTTYTDNYAAHVLKHTIVTERNDSSPGALYPDTSVDTDVKVGAIDKTEEVSVIRDEIKNFLSVPLNANNYNDTPPALLAMSGSANTVTANTDLADAFDLDPINIGRIVRFDNINPGEDYTNDTFALAVDNSIRALERRRQILSFPEADFSLKFTVGDLISQDIGGGTLIEGKIVALNAVDFTMTVRPYTYHNNFTTGVISYKGNNYTVTSVAIDFDSPKISGFNADIFADTNFANGRIKKIQIIDSGFGHKDGDEVDIKNANGEVVAKGTIGVDGSGTTGGFWSSFNSHVNGDTDDGYYDSGKRIQDSDYYQEYSYEVQSKLGIERYEEALKEIVHIAGTKVHGKFNFEEISDAPLKFADSFVDSSFVDTANTANTGNTDANSAANTGGGSDSDLEFISVDTTAYTVDLTSITVDSR